MWEIKDLRYQVGDKAILNGVTLTLPVGQRIGIIGPNGCGKTTFLKHLYGALPAHDAVLLDGKTIQSYAPKKLAQKLAVLGQFADDTEPGLRVEDVVLMGRYPYTERFMGYSHHDREIAEACMAQTGVTILRNRILDTLSGGEKQRVMIARAMTQEPQYLVLDEPTNHLDVCYKLELMKLITAYRGTVVVTLHDLDLAYRYCDAVAILKQGHLIAYGPPQESMTAERLEEVFEVPFRIFTHEGEHYVVMA